MCQEILFRKLAFWFKIHNQRLPTTIAIDCLFWFQEKCGFKRNQHLPLGAHFLGDPLTIINPDEATADTSELQWTNQDILRSERSIETWISQYFPFQSTIRIIHFSQNSKTLLTPPAETAPGKRFRNQHTNHRHLRGLHLVVPEEQVDCDSPALWGPGATKTNSAPCGRGCCMIQDFMLGLKWLIATFGSPTETLLET